MTGGRGRSRMPRGCRSAWSSGRPSRCRWRCSDGSSTSRSFPRKREPRLFSHTQSRRPKTWVPASAGMSGIKKVRTVQLNHQTDFDGWRAAARALRLAGIPPEQVSWRVGEGAGLFSGEPPPPAAPGEGFSAPRTFVDLARDVICHRSPARFGLLYRLLWRLKEEPALLGLVTDPEVAQALSMQRQVGQAEHKMHAFVRFRRADDPDDPATPETYVAWFEPAHFVVDRGAAFFVRRMANLRFSILTLDLCAHWDRAELSFTPGVDKSQAPACDALEDWWRAYYASVFNPARLNPALMTGHMPRRYW